MPQRKKKAGVGSRQQVWNGTAVKTSSGLHKSDLTHSQSGKIVSKKQLAAAKRNGANRKKYGTSTGIGRLFD